MISRFQTLILNQIQLLRKYNNVSYKFLDLYLLIWQLHSSSFCIPFINANEISHSHSGNAKSANWNGSRIELPSKYFEFVSEKKNNKGFSVKCLLCHQMKTKYNRKGEIDFLAITNNSGYNTKWHIKVSYLIHISVAKIKLGCCFIITDSTS